MNRYNADQDEFSEVRKKELMNILGKRLRRKRLDKGLTQEFVAEKAGINPKYLGEIERGIKCPTALVVNKISTALEVPVCSLLSENGCSCVDGEAVIRVGSLFAGRGQKEVKKALRIIEVLFDEGETEKK